MGNVSSARRRARLTGLMAGLVLAGSLATGLPAAAKDTTDDRPLIELLRVVNGTTEALGGGDYTALVVGTHAFGVIYGSANNSSPVTLFTVVQRALGTATVRDAESGRVLGADVTLPFMTLVAERLDAAFEFRDLNGDGIFNFRPNLLTRDPFDFNGSEPAVKGALLDGDWNLTAFELNAVSAAQVDIKLVVTREDIPYRLGFDVRADGDQKLNKLQFTIHVKITRERVQGATVPHFDATVGREGGKRTLESLELEGSAVKNYTATRAVFKVDHDIVGWDFAPPRVEIESRLMLHATLAYANSIDQRIAPWLNDRALSGDRGAAANITDEQNTTTVTPDRQMAEFRMATAVGLRDGFGRAGSLGWAPSATVWSHGILEPVEKRVAFQVLGGVPFAGAYEGRLYRGFVLSAGFLYPVGERIYHDPELMAESVEVEGSPLLPTVLPALILFGEAVLVVGAMAGVLALVVKGSSGSAKARAAEDAKRLEALKARYQLPPSGEPPRRGGD